uniref:Uncharacterized protein n=1 Tax=Mustela putorius furo TaxID=9669 RepID=M3YDY0_MUSPF
REGGDPGRLSGAGDTDRGSAGSSGPRARPGVCSPGLPAVWGVQAPWLRPARDSAGDPQLLATNPRRPRPHGTSSCPLKAGCANRNQRPFYPGSREAQQKVKRSLFLGGEGVSPGMAYGIWKPSSWVTLQRDTAGSIQGKGSPASERFQIPEVTQLC